MGISLTLIHSDYLQQYDDAENIDWSEISLRLTKAPKNTTQDFEYYIVSSSLFSSKIEGNTLDFNSFYRNRGKLNLSKSKEIDEIENLVKAYSFASQNDFSIENFLTTHHILSETLVEDFERGNYRKHQVGVYDSSTGRPLYMAVEAEYIKNEMDKLFADIEILTKSELSHREVLYFASMIHLWIAMIHPFADGNGRAARLAEKWFLSIKLGNIAWSINSEKYYWDNRIDYYKNIALGYNYYVLKWERCMPFLEMLPQTILEIK